MNKSKGFTLPELMVVIAIITVLAVSAVAFTRTSLVNAQFQTVVNEVKQSLLDAQTLSRQNYKNVMSGVAFESDSFTTFSASTYSESDPFNVETELPSTITINGINFGGESEVYFNQFSGVPTNAGGVTITHEDGRTAVITVSSTGNISVNF